MLLKEYNEALVRKLEEKVAELRHANCSLEKDIADRRQTEQRIKYLNRVFAMLSDINQIIVHEKDPQAMLEAACRIAVEKGGFPLAWIGLLDAKSNRMTIAAQAGPARGYLESEQMDVARADGPCGHGLPDEALRAGRHVVCNDLAHDPRMAPWRDAALQQGLHASAAFPIKLQGNTIGTSNLYSEIDGFFDAEELRLLDEEAMDISFALEVSQREQERRKAEEELRWRTAFFEAQVESSLDGILVVDDQRNRILQNQRLNELWKIPPEVAADDASAQAEFLSRRTKNPRQFLDAITDLHSHPDEIRQDVIELLDGTILDRTSSPVRDRAGKYYGRIWRYRDITKQRVLEEQFRQSQKMEAIGQLAGGVAHDFNNILAAIMMQAGLASTAANLPAEAREMLDDIQATSERAANLTRQLLAFSRRQVMQPRQLDLNEIVTNLAKMLQRILGEDVRLQLNLHPRPLLTRADAGMLDQVILNLAVNARDAMPGGGRLFIETGEQTVNENEGIDNPDTTPGRYVCLRVTDAGSGIAPEIKSRIFEPFFTTKEPGKGTGLGLATVFGIVKQHGGSITFESEVGRGSTFQILLPADALPAELAGGATAKSALRHGTETILLVEDELGVRTLTRAVLEQHGYTVLAATHGIEALIAWEQSAGRVHLLLTDIVMPEGISGWDLAAQLKSRKPELKVIFTSGYSADIAGRNLVLQDGQNFIQKPYAAPFLLEVVRRCLDS